MNNQNKYSSESIEVKRAEVLKWMNAYIPNGKTVPVFEDILDNLITIAEARGAKKVPVCQCGDFMVGHDTDGKHGDEYYCIGCDRKVYLQALTPTNETDFDSDEYGPDAFERQGGY